MRPGQSVKKMFLKYQRPVVIATGLFIFGYYALKGEYSKLPESSEEI